jgi:hypothetical protein
VASICRPCSPLPGEGQAPPWRDVRPAQAAGRAAEQSGVRRLRRRGHPAWGMEGPLESDPAAPVGGIALALGWRPAQAAPRGAPAGGPAGWPTPFLPERARRVGWRQGTSILRQSQDAGAAPGALPIRASAPLAQALAAQRARLHQGRHAPPAPASMAPPDEADAPRPAPVLGGLATARAVSTGGATSDRSGPARVRVILTFAPSLG